MLDRFSFEFLSLFRFLIDLILIGEMYVWKNLIIICYIYIYIYFTKNNLKKNLLYYILYYILYYAKIHS
jgi:hypothetical protein